MVRLLQRQPADVEKSRRNLHHTHPRTTARCPIGRAARASGDTAYRQASLYFLHRPSHRRNRRMDDDRAARVVRLPPLRSIQSSRKSLPDTLLGRSQPLLPRMRHTDRTANRHHEEMSPVRQRDVSSHRHSHHRAGAPRRRNTDGACTQFPRHILRLGGRIPPARHWNNASAAK